MNSDTIECPIVPTPASARQDDYIYRQQHYTRRREDRTPTHPCLPTVEALELCRREEQPR